MRGSRIYISGMNIINIGTRRGGKVLVACGCRDAGRELAVKVFDYFAKSERVVRDVWLVIHGASGDVDLAVSDAWVDADGLCVTRAYPADWRRYGKKAGPIRNEEMAKEANICFALWDGESRGTLDMIRRADNHGLGLYVYTFSSE